MQSHSQNRHTALFALERSTAATKEYMMDTMGFIFGMTGMSFGLLGFIFGINGSNSATSASDRIDQLERRLSEAGLFDGDGEGDAS